MIKSGAPVVAFDADGILHNTYPPWLGAWNGFLQQRHGAAARNVTVEDCRNYDLHSCLGDDGGPMTAEQKSLFYDIITKDEEFWANIDPMEGALEAAEALHHDGFDVIVVTAPSGPRSAAGKLRALKKHLPWLDSKAIFLAHQKYRIYADFLVDDAPANAQAQRLYQPHCKVVGVEWPWNAGQRELWDCLAKGHANSGPAFQEILDFIRGASGR